MVRYVRLYFASIFQSWVALLSGIGGIALMLLQRAFPSIPASATEFTVGICFVIAMFAVWFNELLGKEKALRQLADADRKQKLALEVAALVSQGREILRMNHLHFENWAKYSGTRKLWRDSVATFIKANAPITLHIQDTHGLMMEDDDSIRQEIHDDIELLEAVRSAMCAATVSNAS